MDISKMYKKLILLFLVIGIVSCSSQDDNGIKGSEIDDTQLNNALRDVCLEWDADSYLVEGKMNKYDLVQSDADMMAFSNKNKDAIVSYQFENGALIAAMVAFNKPIDEESVSQKLKGYDYVGRLNGNAIYKNEVKNSICNFSVMPFDDVEYSVFGFTPVQSASFDKFEPIALVMDEISGITSSGASVKCSLSGNVDKASVGVVISENEDFSSKRQVYGSYSNVSFSVNVTKLDHDKKYWCYAFAVVDNITHKSNVLSFETAHVDTYEVGDIYPKIGTPEGVVFYTSDGGTHGKIVSFVHGSSIKWDVNGAFSQKAGCNNTSDGSKNNMPSSTSPVASWIRSLGAGWYCPARGELVMLAKVASTVNTTLIQNGYAAHSDFFWSSTEYLSDTAYIVCVASQSHMGYNAGWYSYNTKDEARGVLGVKKF